nr:hypothetical protein [Tanacetum cinerariifolium]
MGSRLTVALVLGLMHGVSFECLTMGSIEVLEPKMSCRLNRLPVGFHIAGKGLWFCLFLLGIGLRASVAGFAFGNMFTETVDPLFFLPTASAFSVAISAFCVAIFSKDVLYKWVLALDSS